MPPLSARSLPVRVDETPPVSQPASTPFLDRLWKLCSSPKLGICLILSIAAVLASATFYEANKSTEAVQATFYRSWWFEALLLLFGFNLTCATLTRWPFRPRHLGFITIHVGILTILAGSVITRRLGLDGELVLREGETRSFFSTQDFCLSVARSDIPGPGISLPIDVANRRARQTLARTFDTGPMGIEVLEYRPDHEVAAGSDGPMMGAQDANIPGRSRAPAREAVPALRLRLSGEGAATQEVWAVWGDSHPLSVGDVVYFLEFGMRRLPLGFAVTCLDFRDTRYPGTEMASTFESDVFVQDPARGREGKRTVSMNNPFTYNDTTLFQSSYLKGDPSRGVPDTTIFSVSRDPGMPVTYTGCAVMLLGFLIIFYVKPYLVKWEIRRLAERSRAASPAADGAVGEPLVASGAARAEAP